MMTGAPSSLVTRERHRIYTSHELDSNQYQATNHYVDREFPRPLPLPFICLSLKGESKCGYKNPAWQFGIPLAVFHSFISFVERGDRSSVWRTISIALSRRSFNSPLLHSTEAIAKKAARVERTSSSSSASATRESNSVCEEPLYTSPFDDLSVQAGANEKGVNLS